MIQSDEYGNRYDDGQPDPNAVDPSQRYLAPQETADEYGNRQTVQSFNPNYELTPEERAFNDAQTGQRGGLWGIGDRVGRQIESHIVQPLSPYVHSAADKIGPLMQKYGVPLAALAISGGTAAEFMPGLMAAEAAAAPAATEGITMGGGASAPGFTTSGALTPAFGGATFGAPATLEAAQAALAATASAAAPGFMETASRYLSNPSNLANLAKQGYGAYKTIAGGAKPAPRAGQAPTGGGQGGQGGLSNLFTDPTLDTSAEFLTGGGGGNKYDLAKVYQQMTPDYPVMAAKGGSINDLSDVLKETFSEKNLFPQSKDLDDRPVLLTSQNPGIKSELAKLKRIKNAGGLAQGGLPQKYAAAAPQGHRPEFITGLTGHYACGKGTGQSDDIPAMLHDGDYVMDAETVSALGDGSSKAGKEVLEGFHKRIPYKRGGQAKPVPAKIADGEYVFDEGFVTALGGGDNRRGSDILDGLRERLRAHKRGAPVNKIPPKAKDPAAYIGKGK